MRVGFSDFSLFSGRTSKFFGIIEFLGGRSSFFELISHFGLLILF
jgi:hypothetical protein